MPKNQLPQHRQNMLQYRWQTLRTTNVCWIRKCSRHALGRQPVDAVSRADIIAAIFKVSHQKSCTVNRCVFTWRMLLSNLCWYNGALAKTEESHPMKNNKMKIS